MVLSHFFSEQSAVDNPWATTTIEHLIRVCRAYPRREQLLHDLLDAQAEIPDKKSRAKNEEKETFKQEIAQHYKEWFNFEGSLFPRNRVRRNDSSNSW